MPQPPQRLAQSSVPPSLAAAAVAALPLAISPAKQKAHAIVVAPDAAAAEGGLQEGATHQQIPAAYPTLPAGVIAGTGWHQPISGSLPAAGHQTLGLAAIAKASGSAVAGSADMAAAASGAACWSQADYDVQAAVWGMLHTLQCAPSSCHALAAETLCRCVACPGLGGVVNACVEHAILACRGSGNSSFHEWLRQSRWSARTLAAQVELRILVPWIARTHWLHQAIAVSRQHPDGPPASMTCNPQAPNVPAVSAG